MVKAESPVTAFDADIAQRMYEDDGLSFAEIGRRFGVSAAHVSKSCYANGSKKQRRKPDEAQRPQIASRRPSAHAFDHDEAIRLYEVEHLSFEEIARRLSVSGKSVREVCYKAGVATPNAARKRKIGNPTSDLQLLERFARLTVGEPDVREDGLCAVCEGDREIVRSATYAPRCAEVDPFCSTECAREFHGNPIPVRPFHPNREAITA